MTTMSPRRKVGTKNCSFGAVLLGLAAALRLLVGVERAFDAVDLAVEQVDERPHQIADLFGGTAPSPHHCACVIDGPINRRQLSRL